MFEPKLPASIDGINLASPRFWIKPADEREGALELLRRERRVSFHPELPEDGMPAGPGFWALSHHADIVEVSRNPEVWSSSPTSTIHDFPPELEPYFDTMVNMDDPRHTRLRRIVSRGFTPAELGKLEHAISRRATRIINAVIEKGECDFVDDIADSGKVGLRRIQLPQSLRPA